MFPKNKYEDLVEGKIKAMNLENTKLLKTKK